MQRPKKASKVSAMKVHGEAGSQRAIRTNGKELSYGPTYNRTLSMDVLKVTSPNQKLDLLVRQEKVQQGELICSLYEDEGCIKPRNEFGSMFNANLLEKVRLEDDLSKPKEEFYPVLKRFLAERRNWGPTFAFQGLSTFVVFLMEWTERITDKYRGLLKEAGIYGLVVISQFPYHYNKEVLKAFCEHWSPLTNTLHHGGGEVGISLMDLRQIGGLPISGEAYEEYLPPNEQILSDTKYPSTVVELLRTHVELCRHSKDTEVSWHKWIQHFYRGDQKYAAYGENSPSDCQQESVSRSTSQLPLRISDEGELAAYLALLLSRFVLPFGSRSIRPETFVMACLMARGKRISLAPTVLGHIYHELGRIATHPGNPSDAEPHFGIHFLIGWLAEYFPSLYSCRPDDDFEEAFPCLAKYAGVPSKVLNLYQARLTFRGVEHISYRAVNFGSDIEGEEQFDTDSLSTDCFEHLMTIRSAVLPVRFGSTLMLEPYYPNRFARQFGFDQGIPANQLKFSFARRSRRSLEDIALASAHLLRTNTGTKFRILPNFHEGTYTATYCRWWARTSAPYLTQSCHKVKTILTGKNSIEREPPIYVIENRRIILDGLRKQVRISERLDKALQSPPPVESSSYLPDTSEIHISGKRPAEALSESKSSSEEDFFKRQRRARRSDESNYSQSVGFHASPVHDAFYTSDNMTFEADNTTLIDDDVAEVNDTTPVEADDATLIEDGAPVLTRDDVLILVNHDNIATPSASLPQIHSSSVGKEPPAVAFVEKTVENLQPLACTSLKRWVQNSLADGIKAISTLLSRLKSAQEILPERPHILQFLAALRAMAEHNDVDLTRYVSKVQDILDNVEAVAVIISTVDVKHFEQLSAQLVEHSSKFKRKQERLSHFEAQRSLELQKEEKELSILKEKVSEMELKIETNKAKHTADSAGLQDSILTAEKEMKLLQGKLDETHVKLADLKLKEAKIQALASEVVTFSLFD